MIITAFRRFLLLVALAAVSLSAQTQVMFTVAGTMNGAPSEGYNTNDPITFTFVMSTASTPTGGSNTLPPSFFWIRDSSTSLFSSVSATGLTGTWNGTDSTGAVTDDEIVINTTYNSLTLQTYANNGDLRFLAPDNTHVATGIIISAQWSGLNLSETGYSDPVAYFAARAGVYNFVPGSQNIDYLFNAGSPNFLPTTLTISAAAIPEPATTASLAGLGALALVFLVRRRTA